MFDNKKWGPRINKTKLTENIVRKKVFNRYDDEIRELFESGERATEIAEELGLTLNFVSEVLRRLKLKGSER